MIPTKEQIQWFWEQCGLKHTYNHIDYGWWSPDGVQFLGCPPIDLNNLLKYAVPKLPEGASLDIIVWNGYYEVIIWQRGIKPSGIEVVQCNIIAKEWNTDDLALALFWAVYKALGGKE